MTTSKQVEIEPFALLDIETMEQSFPNGVRAAELARNRALVSSPPADRVTSHVRLVSYKFKARSALNRVKDVAGPKVVLSVADIHVMYTYEIFHKEERCPNTCILCYQNNEEHVDSLAPKVCHAVLTVS